MVSTARYSVFFGFLPGWISSAPGPQVQLGNGLADTCFWVSFCVFNPKGEGSFQPQKVTGTSIVSTSHHFDPQPPCVINHFIYPERSASRILLLFFSLFSSLMHIMTDLIYLRPCSAFASFLDTRFGALSMHVMLFTFFSVLCCILYGFQWQ